jgi:RNA polymerase sigma factor (sigma-70 family)
LTAWATLPIVDSGDVVPRRPAVSAESPAEIVTELERCDGQPLFGFARRMGLNDSQADDAVQETLVRIYVELRRGVVILNPRAWAFRACYRLCMDLHRSRTRLGRVTERIRPVPARPSDREVDDRLAVWAEVDRLPLRQRQVVYLRYSADLTFEEIGTTLGITSSAARSHDAQARAVLRQRLAAEER